MKLKTKIPYWEEEPVKFKCCLCKGEVTEFEDWFNRSDGVNTICSYCSTITGDENVDK
jgi:hypothetical protein